MKNIHFMLCLLLGGLLLIAGCTDDKHTLCSDNCDEQYDECKKQCNEQYTTEADLSKCLASCSTLKNDCLDNCDDHDLSSY